VTTSMNRQELLAEIERLAEFAIFGTPSETYRTCGQKTCRCHGPGPKHGPHLHISFRGPDGKTAGYCQRPHMKQFAMVSKPGSRFRNISKNSLR